MWCVISLCLVTYHFVSYKHLWIFNQQSLLLLAGLTHWGRVTHICINKTTIIGSDNGLSPGRCQAIIWTNAGILLIGTLGTNNSEISNQMSFLFIREIAYENVIWKMAAILFRPQCVKAWVLSYKEDRVRWAITGEAQLQICCHLNHLSCLNCSFKAPNCLPLCYQHMWGNSFGRESCLDSSAEKNT